MENILNRFLRYITIDTQSDENSNSQPSTAKQLNLLKLLCKELNDVGIPAQIDEYGYIMGKIPSNIDEKVPAIGFISHVDTSPDSSGKDIKPQIIENYDGKDIALKGVPGLYLKPTEFPILNKYIGKTLITTDGTTLLGADDKAGIAEIMYAAEYIMLHPDFKHGDICIGFTPDEEIGRGTVKFDVAKFGAKYAYTIDGGEIGELEFENFNAASAKIHISGRNIHPGSAKGKMKNAIIIGSELNSLLPVEQRPEFTEGYEGFFHIVSFIGTVEEADISYIIRDHDSNKFEVKKMLIKDCCEFINKKYGEGTANPVITDQYRNMREQIEPHYQIVEKAAKAMEMEGIRPKIQPIRGGTDGANLSFKGLPCPNIFAGGHNFHGKMEFVPLESMEAAAKVILNIISLFTK